MLSYQLADSSPPGPPVSRHTSQGRKETSCAFTGKRAVIVEDEGITQLQLTRILRSQGIEVVATAANGQEAVEIVLKEHPDFVLMDIRMPVMDGLEASERILAQLSVCIVMLTAFSDEEYQQRAETLGTCGYVLKPVTVETLIPELEAAYQKFQQP